jgi:hypothetical protein
MGYAPLNDAALNEAFRAALTHPVPDGGGLQLVGWVELFAKPACDANGTAADGFRKGSTHPTDKKRTQKSPARFPARAHFLSFNFLNTSIRGSRQ